MVFLTLNNITELGKITLHKFNRVHFQVVGVSMDIIKTSSERKVIRAHGWLQRKQWKPPIEAVLAATGITQLSRWMD